MFKYLAVLATALAALLLPAAGASQAATSVTRVTGTFTAATDTVKPVGDTNPRGTVVFSQPTGGGPITGVVSITGLAPNKAYLVVPYTDPVCAPAPGVTAFPSSRFTTDANGNASATVTVTPNVINPLATLDLRTVRSVSTREVLVQGGQSGPITVPNAPWPITEACDTNPGVVNTTS
jgi:hypothetical protein